MLALDFMCLYGTAFIVLRFTGFVGSIFKGFQYLKNRDGLTKTYFLVSLYDVLYFFIAIYVREMYERIKNIIKQ